MSVDPRTPCIIGVDQLTHRPEDGPSPEPLDLWERVCRSAVDDAASRDPSAVLRAVDSLDVVYCMSWAYDDPPGRLAERLRIDPRRRKYSGIGGTTPQVLIHDAAAAIQRGELDVALIASGEALATRRRLRKTGSRPAWSHRHPEPPPFPFEAPFHPAEVAHEVFQAWITFPLFDVARRARLGVEIDAHRGQLAELLVPLTKVAAKNPHAWFPTERTADELATPTDGNRILGHPYTTQMVSVIDTDQAAAVIVAAQSTADALGVPQERRVYLHGSCHASDPVYVAEHPDLAASPAVVAASTEALRVARTSIDEIAHLELFSCFPSALNLVADALGLDDDDHRPRTVTGGLPFAGGAGGTGYLTHAVAAMTDVVRADPGTRGLVSGVGMHMTRHVFAVYGTEPRSLPVADEDRLQAGLDASPSPSIRDTAEGPARVVAVTVAHGRDGEPDWGLAVCDLPEGDRCYAKVLDRDVLLDIERTEWVGRAVTLERGDGNVNLLRP